MEEEQKFEVSQPEEPKKNGSKKGLIIGLVIVLILALAGGAYYYFFVNKSTKLQLSDKDKIVNSLDKIEAKVDEITEGYKGESKRKISDNLAKKPFKNTFTITGEINEIDIDGVKASDVAMVKQLISGQQIVLDGQGNFSENKYYAELTAAGQKIGNLVFNDNVIGVQVPLVESKYYALFKDSLASSNYKDLAEIFGVFKYLSDDSLDLDKYKFSDKEEKHFKDTYGKVLDKYVTDDKISKEATEVTIDGKTKKCDKVVYTLDNATIKSLLKDYVETLKNDTEGQEIIFNKVSDIAEATKVLELAGISKEQLKSQVTLMIPQMVEQVLAVIDEIPFEKAEIIAYATNTETYKVELSVYAEDGDALKITADLRDKGMKIAVSIENEELLVADIENGDDGLKAIVEMDEVKFEITDKKEKDSNKFSMKVTANELNEKTTMELRATTKVNEDTDKKLNEDIELALIVEVNDEKVDVVLNVNKVVEIVDSISVPEVTKENAIDIVREGYLDAVMKELTGSSYKKNTGDNFDIPSITTPDTTTQNNTVTNTTIDTNSLNNELNNIVNDMNSLGL